MAFKFRVQRRPIEIDLPSFPRLSGGDDEEVLTGSVQGMQASEMEERLAIALSRARIPFEFRLVLGAPKGLPGWKELDFLASSGGILYAIEVDTVFTHRNKEQKDRLHDAIVLNDPELNSYGTLYPSVLHVEGDHELADRGAAKQYVRRQFGKG